MYDLYIANKNYSSWSLRPWVLMRELAIPFSERLVRFDDPSAWSRFRAISPSGKVPCLVDGNITVWESLAIAEYLAERHPGSGPPIRARAPTRAAPPPKCMPDFPSFATVAPMSCGVRIRLHEIPDALTRDIARLEALWGDGLSRFGGPFLAGAGFTAVDAFFAPVAFRAQTYGLHLGADAAAYVGRLLELDSMRRWYADGVAETSATSPTRKRWPA